MTTETPDLRSTGPVADPRAYSGVLTRRVVASFLDVFALTLLLLVGTVLLAVVTFGVGAILVWAFLPVVPIVAILYVAITMSGPEQATYGMRMAGIRLERTDGRPIDGPFAALHSFLFWLSVTFITPLVLLIGLFTNRRQLGHDLVLGTVMVRSDRALR